MGESELIETMPGANTAPPVLLLQGTGGTNQEMLNFGRRLAPQSPLITIAGRQGVGSQRQYFRQTASTPADPQQLETEARWLAEQVTAICRNHRWNRDHLITVGYSNGAAMAAYGLQTGCLPGATALLFHPLWVPVARPQNQQHRQVWLSAGRHDPLVSVATVQRVADACAATGMQTTVTVTGGTHHMTPGEVLQAYQWLAPRLTTD